MKSCTDRNYLAVGNLALYRIRIYLQTSTIRQWFDVAPSFAAAAAQPNSNEGLQALHLVKRMQEAASNIAHPAASTSQAPGNFDPGQLSQLQFDEMLQNSAAFKAMGNSINAVASEMANISHGIDVLGSCLCMPTDGSGVKCFD